MDQWSVGVWHYYSALLWQMRSEWYRQPGNFGWPVNTAKTNKQTNNKIMDACINSMLVRWGCVDYPDHTKIKLRISPILWKQKPNQIQSCDCARHTANRIIMASLNSVFKKKSHKQANPHPYTKLSGKPMPPNGSVFTTTSTALQFI